jgi:hypothetical protein
MNIFYQRLLQSQSKSLASSAPSASDVLAMHFTKAVMFGLGRPLWQSLKFESVNEAISFAKSKLLCVSHVDPSKHIPSVAQMLAVLSVRVPFTVQAYGELSESLPAQHMRLVG